MSGYLQRLINRSTQVQASIRSTASLPFATAPSIGFNEGLFEEEKALAQFPSRSDSINPTESNSSDLVMGSSDSRLPNSNEIQEPHSRNSENDPKIEFPNIVPKTRPSIQAQPASLNQSSLEPATQTSFHEKHNAPEFEQVSLPQLADFAPLVKDEIAVGQVKKFDSKDATEKHQLNPVKSSSLKVITGKHLGAIRSRNDSPLEDSFTEPQEVHVSIGRIEITAVHAPQTGSKPFQQPARKTMSLEEYLEQRNKERL